MTGLNPLQHLHDHADAEFQAFGDIEIVYTFGEPQAEYAAIHKSCGMMDLPQRGILQLTGPDRFAFLDNLVTNQTWDKESKTPMAACSGVYAFLLNNKGRIITDLNILELGDRLWVQMQAGLVPTIREMFDKYLFGEKVELADRTGDLHQIALHGPGAAAVLGDAGGGSLPDLTPMRCAPASLFGRSVCIWRDDQTVAPGYTIVCDTGDAPVIWSNLLANFGQSDQLGKRRLRPIGWAMYNATRIEAGRPLFGIDFDDTVLPAETGLLDRAVSFTKGCYLGQEIVARMHSRGALPRKLVGLIIDEDSVPVAGAKLHDADGNEVGGITSSTLSPVLSNRSLALGYVKKGHYEEGTTLQVPAEGAMRTATITALPFVAPVPAKTE